eukprot:TRINITY_DN12993_c0_g1_i1.p1 TRINITY_DN12993_c0_g1~~TRINITY_DN12993_c0_g1_i1.p1  ORF type:complete len:1016 (+),score=247.13 TRINITY_DN12993_c0_g1_i1:2-3049(+)
MNEEPPLPPRPPPLPPINPEEPPPPIPARPPPSFPGLPPPIPPRPTELGSNLIYYPLESNTDARQDHGFEKSLTPVSTSLTPEVQSQSETFPSSSLITEASSYLSSWFSPFSYFAPTLTSTTPVRTDTETPQSSLSSCSNPPSSFSSNTEISTTSPPVLPPRPDFQELPNLPERPSSLPRLLNSSSSTPPLPPRPSTPALPSRPSTQDVTQDSAPLSPINKEAEVAPPTLPERPPPLPGRPSSLILTSNVDGEINQETEGMGLVNYSPTMGSLPARCRDSLSMKAVNSPSKFGRERFLYFDPNCDIGKTLLRFPSVRWSTEISVPVNESTLPSFSLEIYRDEDTLITMEPDQTVILRNAVLKIGDLQVHLGPNSAAFSPKFGTYLFLKDYYYVLIMIDHSSDEEKIVLRDFERLLNEIVTFQKLEDVVRPEKKEIIPTSTSKFLDTTAEKIEGTGEMIGQTLISTAGVLGKSMRTTSSVFRTTTEKYKGEEKELSEKEMSSYEWQKDKTHQLMEASNFVINGISKTVDFVGGKVVEGAVYTYKASKNAYDQTDYAIIKRYENGNKPSNDAYKKSLWNVTKASFQAIGHLATGVKNAGISIATDARDIAIEQTEHRKGTAEAQRLHKRLEIGGRLGLTALNVTELYGYVSVRSAAALTYKVGVQLGKSVTTYDLNRESVLFGAPWKMGWAALRESAIKGFKSHWLILRNYSLAWYSSPNEPWDKPVDYVKTRSIKRVERISEDLTHKRYCFQVIAKSRVIYISLECNDLTNHWSAFLSSFTPPSSPDLSSINSNLPPLATPPFPAPPSVWGGYPLSNPFNIDMDGQPNQSSNDAKNSQDSHSPQTSEDPMKVPEISISTTHSNADGSTVQLKETVIVNENKLTIEEVRSDVVDEEEEKRESGDLQETFQDQGGTVQTTEGKKSLARIDNRKSFYSKISVFGSRGLEEPHHSWLTAEIKHWKYLIASMSSLHNRYMVLLQTKKAPSSSPSSPSTSSASSSSLPVVPLLKNDQADEKN